MTTHLFSLLPVQCLTREIRCVWCQLEEVIGCSWGGGERGTSLSKEMYFLHLGYSLLHSLEINIDHLICLRLKIIPLLKGRL